MPLQHQLRMPRLRIPKLHPAILTPTHHPPPIRRQRHTQHEILMPLKRANALPILRVRPSLHAETRVIQLPHPDRLVQTARHQVRAVGREGYTIDAVFVPLLAFGPLDQHARLRVPDADALVQGAGGDEAAVGADGDGGHAVFDLEREDALVFLDVPEADGAVAGARGDVAAVGGEVQGVDVLVVAGKGVANLLGRDVPDLEQLLLANAHGCVCRLRW